MRRFWNSSSRAARAAIVAAGVSLGILAGKFVGECISARGSCSVANPAPWIAGAAAFVGAWIVAGAAMWALNWHKEQLEHPRER